MAFVAFVALLPPPCPGSGVARTATFGRAVVVVAVTAIIIIIAVITGVTYIFVIVIPNDRADNTFKSIV